jgi:hypothetical protein
MCIHHILLAAVRNNRFMRFSVFLKCRDFKWTEYHEFERDQIDISLLRARF